MHNLPFENNRRKAKEILEIVHSDLNGPHKTTGNCGEKYFLSFIDDYSKLAKVYCIKSKDQVYDCFVKYVNEVENLTEKRIKKLRCDNGKEYLNSNVYRFAREKGISIDVCPPYTHELNGTAERYNRSIMDMARCLLAEAKVNRCFWPEVVKAAAYLKNRSLANTVERKTPYEIFFNTRPCVKNLRIYGSRIFVRVPEERRKSKWDKKAELGVLLGYTEVGYRILLNNKIIVARHVDIVEEHVKCIGFKSNGMKENESENSQEDKLEETEYEKIKFKEDTKTQGSKSEEDTKEKPEKFEDLSLRRSKREKKTPARFNDDYVYQFVYVNYCNAAVPDTFEEAIASEEAENWKAAMKSEMDNLEKNKTWKLMDLPENKNALDVKWVYTKKSNGTFKVRLVVKGFQQEEVTDNTYSPVFRMQTLKLLLSYCCQNSLIIEQMDVETAFLNGNVVSEVYVKQPLGYDNGSNKGRFPARTQCNTVNHSILLVCQY